MKFNIPPVRSDVKIIRSAAFIMSLNPSSFKRTIKEAMHGKYMVSTTLAMISCFKLSPRGASIPTATSFLKKPTRIDMTASLGSPRIPVITGCMSLPRKSIIPRV